MLNPQVEKSSRKIRFLKLLFKIAVTILCLWYVSTKIDFEQLGNALSTIDWLYLALAFAAFIISKFIASYRLNIYFRNISIFLSEKENLRLFWLGMFYNLFLPGSITGDAYKVVVLSPRFNVRYKQTTAAVLLDRFSGLLGLGLILSVYSIFALEQTAWVVLLITGAVGSVFITYLVVRRYFKEFLPGFWPTFFLGFGVQVMMVACIYAVMHALHIKSDQTIYVFIFLVAVVVSVLPLTVGGGLGIREFVFYEGARYLGMDEHTAIIISLVFYFVTLVTSLFGSVYMFRRIFEEKAVTTQ